MSIDLTTDGGYDIAEPALSAAIFQAALGDDVLCTCVNDNWARKNLEVAIRTAERLGVKTTWIATGQGYTAICFPSGGKLSFRPHPRRIYDWGGTLIATLQGDEFVRERLHHINGDITDNRAENIAMVPMRRRSDNH